MQEMEKMNKYMIMKQKLQQRQNNSPGKKVHSGNGGESVGFRYYKTFDRSI